MSAAAKKRANLKSGGTDKSKPADATPIVTKEPSQNNLAENASAQNLSEVGERAQEFEDDVCFDQYMIKPSNIKDIWRTFKVKKAMFEFMEWYFRPKTSYEPERIDYNALNILAEY